MLPNYECVVVSLVIQVDSSVSTTRGGNFMKSLETNTPKSRSEGTQARLASHLRMLTFAVIGAACLAPRVAFAQNPGPLQTIYSFGTAGFEPLAGLVQGNNGELYGTTCFGTANVGGSGTVFEVTPNGTFNTLYSFSPFLAEGQNIDGAFSHAGLVLGSNGVLFGTTTEGGSGNVGTVFKITPTGAFTVLHTFTGATDGSSPDAALALGTDGNFYGTTSQGGAGGFGTVFKMTSAGALTTLYSFKDTTDGAVPKASLVQGPDGNFYGTTSGDYDPNRGHDYGTVFKITPTGILTTLHAFSALNGALANSDGAVPTAGVVVGRDGNYYGTASQGGAGGQGTIFRLTPSWVFTTLHSFTTVNDLGENSDGASPQAPLLLASDGNFYGTTNQGGQGSVGTLFRITSSGALTSLNSFLNDGDGPVSGVIQGADGNLYGTTPLGGASGGGTVFEYILPATVTAFSPAGGPVGTTVTITGTDFTGASAVAFHGTPAATFTVVSANKITAVVPVGATTGTISVTTPGGVGVSATAFTVIKLQSLAFSPATVAPGATAIGRVTLSSAAPNGGAAIVVSVNGFAYTSFAIPVGQTTGSFTATPATGSSAGNYVFTATYGGSSQSASLTVTSLLKLSFNPSLIVPGASTTGTVTLSTPAPTGGAVIAITLGDFALETVTIPAGQTKGTFTLTTSPTAPQGVYEFGANYDGETANATVTVQALT